MKRYLAIKLQGLMQAWGGHTYEDFRHSEVVPTRSGVLGLLAACIGIDRHNITRLENLSASIALAVRVDSKPTRITDFHTVEKARKVDGTPNDNPVVSRREYLCDAFYTLLVWNTLSTGISIDTIAEKVREPVYTPFLGRRSCPLGQPLFIGFITSDNLADAYRQIEPKGGVIYSDERINENDAIWRLRDEPVYARKRQFASRTIFIHSPGKEAGYASK
ncbi:MAG: type I-E CRISPR-associated protein Cas5/CasD [Candidatus Neomarinimicrobiota bacterium]